MPFYRVQVTGRNFQLADHAGQGPCSFVTTVELVAETADQAERLTQNLLSQHPQLIQQINNPDADPPLIFCVTQEISFLSTGAGDQHLPELVFSNDKPLVSPFTIDDLFTE